ncbi:sugar ABC transporter substrate-binding protein [Actinobacteria bacterium YIM 96077]|uniref:Xylitol/threitol ABC transporter substrate-binding protein n=1 Tax=Phytoactinopolyspora halophila TaxID=1981511 RepID=A0A329R1Q1_9ACTN|nr:sugar ABC transporter substrate-binding protein [Actinobacteria bacterium YIM 96077]RAW17889.1 xylitol/threitol ABC transporter substrate-binding protein [Phytoactinopolyspora halophila]
MSRLTHVAVGTAFLSLALAGCGAGDPNADTASTGDDEQEQIRVGVTVYNMSSFITEGQEGMETYAEANNIELLWNSADDDVSIQADHVDQYVNAGVDAIIVVPVQADSLQPQINAANEADIPILAVNAQLDSDDLAASVQPDDVHAGAQQMEMMAEELDGEGNIVILQGPLGGSGEMNRTKGNDQVLEEYPDIEVLARETANWSRNEAVNRMNNWISAFGDDIDGVVAQNDDMGLGALQALREAGMDDIPIVGIDGIEDGLAAVKDGDMIGTSLQNGAVELAAGLAVAERIVRGEDVDREPVYVMPAITQENVDVAMEHVVTEREAFLEDLPELTDQNLETGDIAYEDLPGQ